MKTAKQLYHQAMHIGRFEPKSAEEHIIAKDKTFSYLYAKNVLKGKFELGEAILATDKMYIHYYARYVLGRRFELGERVVLESDWANDYLKFVCLPDEELMLLKLRYPNL